MAACGECKFWRALPDEAGFGTCRRYAPRAEYTVAAQRTPDAGLVVTWPGTRRDDWCGEFTRGASTMGNKTVKPPNTSTNKPGYRPGAPPKVVGSKKR